MGQRNKNLFFIPALFSRLASSVEHILSQMNRQRANDSNRQHHMANEAFLKPA
jgi:hypothetical protein